MATFDRSYSIWLERELGKPAAYCFAAGIDMLRDYLDQDLAELAGMPRGTHVGELRGSWLDGSLPPVWQTRYDYELLFRLRVVAEEMRTRMVHPGYDGDENLIRCVADDLVLHLALGLGQVSAELADSNAADDWDEWLLELNGEDDEVIPLLFSQTSFPAPDAPRHIDNWFVPAYWQTEVDDDADTSPELPTLP